MKNNRSKKPKSPLNKSPIELLVAKYGLVGTIIGGILGLVGVIFTATLTYTALTNQVERPIQATQTAEARQTSIALSASPTISPTVTESPTATTTPIPDFTGYDFENDKQGWQTSEGEFKLAHLNTTSVIAYHGTKSLVLEMELYGSGTDEFANRNNEDVFRHTEAVVYFNQIPSGINIPGPYDLTEKRLSCFVYLPTGLVVSENAPPAYVRLFVKDSESDNQYSEPVMITNETSEQWLELIYVVRADPNTNFDTKQVNAMGVRLDSLDDSTVSYEGPVYIDYCRIDF